MNGDVERVTLQPGGVDYKQPLRSEIEYAVPGEDAVQLGECEGEPISAFPRISGDRAWVVDDLRGKIGNPNDIDQVQTDAGAIHADQRGAGLGALKSSFPDQPTRRGAFIFFNSEITLSAVIRPVFGFSVGIFSMDISNRAESDSTTI